MRLLYNIIRWLFGRELKEKVELCDNKEKPMAYTQNWHSKEKPPEKEMISYLTSLVPDMVDTAFLVIGASDDGGRHIVMMAEWDENEKSPWKEISKDFDNKGWRTMRMTVPQGYLEAFFNTDGSRRITKSSD